MVELSMIAINMLMVNYMTSVVELRISNTHLRGAKSVLGSCILRFSNASFLLPRIGIAVVFYLCVSSCCPPLHFFFVTICEAKILYLCSFLRKYFLFHPFFSLFCSPQVGKYDYHLGCRWTSAIFSLPTMAVRGVYWFSFWSVLSFFQLFLLWSVDLLLLLFVSPHLF